MLKQGWMLKTQDFSEFSELQGGRSCAGARVAPAEKFGLGRKFLARTYAILSRIKICCNLRTFWRPLGKRKCLFGSKTVFLGQEMLYYMVYIAYFTELILQICDYAQKRRIWRENCKYALDENFHCHFCSRRKAAKFCHPATLHLRPGQRGLWHHNLFIDLDH